MDDLLILATSRSRLRRAIRLVKQGLDEMGLTPHPEKTWVGRAERGVDFLGYRISAKGIVPAPATVARAVTRLHRLDEQQGRDPRGTAALGAYVAIKKGEASGPRPVSLHVAGGVGAAGGLPDLQPCLTPLPPPIAQQE